MRSAAHGRGSTPSSRPSTATTASTTWKTGPEISDAAYDRLLRELQELEAAYPGLAARRLPDPARGRPPGGGLPDRRAAGADALPRKRHGRGARCAPSTSGSGGSSGSSDPVAYAGEPKLDGAGVELVYEHGGIDRRLHPWGRPDRRGRDGKSPAGLDLPLALAGKHPARVSVRGEVVLPLAAFRRLNEARRQRGEEPFANPRNAAAGALRQLHDIDRRRLGALEFRAYAVAEGLPAGLPTQMGVLGQLAAWGFRVSAECEACRRRRRRDRLPRAPAREAGAVCRSRSTATVFKVDRLDLQAELGELPRSPRWAIAFKFPPAAGDDGRRGHRGAGGANGSADAGGEAAPGAGRRRHRLERVAAQPGRGRPQGRTRGRHRRGAACRRRDPPDRRGREGEASLATRAPSGCPRSVRCAARGRSASRARS